MNRSNFLKLTLLAPLARLFGWKKEPQPRYKVNQRYHPPYGSAQDPKKPGWMVLERSDDGGATWTEIANCKPDQHMFTIETTQGTLFRGGSI